MWTRVSPVAPGLASRSSPSTGPSPSGRGCTPCSTPGGTAPMRFATKAVFHLAAAAMLALPLAIANAQVTSEPVLGRFSDEQGGLNLVAGKDQGKSATAVLTTVYDNTSASALVGVSSTDLSSQWGDE